MGAVAYTRSPPYLAYVDTGQPDDGDDRLTVYLSGTFLPVALIDQDPGCARFLSGLAAFSRLVVFDRSGLGYADPIADWETPVVETWSADLERLLDELEAPRCTLVASTFAAGVAATYASRHPDRVDRLVLINCGRHVSQQLLDDTLRSIDPEASDGGHADWPAILAPTRANDPAFVDWWARTGQQAASPTVAAKIWSSVMSTDIGDVLSRVRAPTLLIHRGTEHLNPPERSREAAALVPDSKLVELPGPDLLEFAGDIDALIAEIATFCTGSPTRLAPSRGLVTLLLTDIVSSTERAARSSPGDWRGVLDRHDELARHEIGRYGGAVVKHTGDGLLSTFDSPSRALRAATAIRAALVELDVQVRCGVHLGEVDQRGGDVAGLNVHLVARIAAEAGAGEILCSSALPVVVSGGSARFESDGTHALKGFDGDWELFRLVRPPS